MADKRQQLIETAFELFYRYGVHAVGINQILQQAGVAKKTLYSHFGSKESLLQAVLLYRDEKFFDWLAARMLKAVPGKPALLELFDALDDWFNNRVETLTNFNGCFFINTCGEYGDAGTVAHQLCREHKLRVRSLIKKQVARLAPSEDEQMLVDMLSLLKEGAIVTAQVQGDKQAAVKARQFAEKMLSGY